MKSKSTEIKECVEHCMDIHKEFDLIISTRLKFTLNMYDSDSCSGEELNPDKDTHTVPSLWVLAPSLIAKYHKTKYALGSEYVTTSPFIS